MYLIGSGSATVRIVPGHPVELHEGDFFGEMALLERRRHLHDVIADTPCRVYVLDSEALARLSPRHPEIVKHIKNVAKVRALEDERLRKETKVRKSKAKRSLDETETS